MLRNPNDAAGEEVDIEQYDFSFETVADAIEYFEAELDNDHSAYEIRSSGEYPEDAPAVPSVTTGSEWWALGEEPDENYQARCSCGETHTSWEAAEMCPGSPDGDPGN